MNDTRSQRLSYVKRQGKLSKFSVEKTLCNPTKVLKIIRWIDKIDPSKLFMLLDQRSE